MSCNGCRVLRKGCSESCVLRPCIQWIESPEAQGHATVFVAKFFGRAGLMSFISAVPETQRPALFQSLLYEACGRTINPVNGAVGLLATGNWSLCQAAVDKVLRGGTLSPQPELAGAKTGNFLTEAEGDGEICARPRNNWPPSFSAAKRRKFPIAADRTQPPADLHLCLTQRSSAPTGMDDKRRPGSPSMNSEESVTTTEDNFHDRRPRLLNLLV
ncbi:LOB domain-containing protein 37-like [Phalaenopsis equestris]|uniref:LOB domain-containing protein 37-like n=1 Tax=Phalaenopsis equestris TaxID=78828 RepID=UPI0009E5C610|nr:LOB domain-containing protein 37-like [Phalaenopsis equestris]